MKEKPVSLKAEDMPITECDFILRLIAYFSEEKLHFEVVGENKIQVKDGSNGFIITVEKCEKSI